MACSHTTTCPLFPLISVNNALKVWKTFYCEGKFESCARYNLSHSGQGVPANLLPNGKTLTTAGFASEVLTEPMANAQAVEKAAPQIVEEMASIELDELSVDIGSDAGVVDTAPGASHLSADPVPETIADGAASSWYLRIMADTDKGVVGSVIQSLGSHRIKIDAMAEKRQNGPQVKMLLIVITDQTTEENLASALTELQQMPSIVGPVKRIPLEHISADMFE